MKKIITLALAAVMTLGLVVLPQAEKGEDLKAYAEKVTAVATAQEAYDKAKKELDEAEKAAVKAEKEQKEAIEKQAEAEAAKAKADAGTNQATKEAAEKALAAAKTAVTTTQEAYKNALTDVLTKKAELATAEKDLKDAKANLRKADYGYVTVKDENGDKLVDEQQVPAGIYKVEDLLKTLGLEDYVLADEDKDGYIVIADRASKTIKVAVKRPLTVKAIDEEGRELGMYKVLTGKKAVKGWVTANEVAPKALTFKGEVQKEIGVDGYWVLADVKANDEQQFFNSFTKGGQNFITAVYTVAKRAKMDKNGKAAGVNSTKPGQVGKTGEVATVATGLGALMTLAGVVLATKRH